MTIPASAVEICPQCATQLAPTMLACPVCGRLVHGEQLTALAQAAREATDRGDISSALAAWREALVLLPVNSRQHEVIAATITELGERLPHAPPASQPAAKGKNPLVRAAAGVGALGLMLWKAKALLLGLTKGTTVFSMLLSLGVYWTAWGWKFALGIVLSIYVHEMGHVIALRRYGFKATAPMFIPGIGAMIRMQQKVVNPREDADIGLAGPIYGLGAAIVALVIWLITQEPIFAAIAGVGAWINLFNLLPLGPLDGGRGFHALSRAQKLLAAASAGAAWLLTQDGLLVLFAVVGLFRALADKSQRESNWKATITYILLIAALATVRLQAGLEE